MTNRPVIGKDCILATFDIADWATPTYAAVPNAKNVSQPGITKNMVSLASRGTSGWDPKGAGLKSMDLQFEYLYESEDSVLETLRGSFTVDTVLGFAVLDGPADGEFPATLAAADVYDVQGFKFPGIVSEMPTAEELEEGKSFDIKVDFARYKLSGTLLLPTWVTISGSQPS